MINQIIELTIEKNIFGGKGIAYYNGYTILIDKVLAKQKVKVKIIKKQGNIYFGEVIHIIDSNIKENVACGYFLKCGGCSYPFVSYDQQFDIKKNLFEEQLNNNKIFNNIHIRYIKSADRFFYRNKAEFSFNCDNINNTTSIGFHKINKYNEIINIDSCFLINKNIQNVLTVFKKNLQTYIDKYGIKFINDCKHLLIRSFDDSILCVEMDKKNNIILDCLKNVCDIIKVVAIKYGNNIDYLTDEKTIIATVGRYKYEVGINTFFQTNTNTCKLLYDTIYDFLEPAEYLCEMYCGVCSIGIYVSDKCKNIISSDINMENIELAKKNLRLNDISNIQLIHLPAEDFFNVYYQHNKIDSVIVDPSRPGLHKNVIKYIHKVSPKQVIYISCNLSTLLRDLSLLFNIGYDIIDVAFVDMFPYTYHMEIVINLKRNNMFKF